jgi:predicted secreted hydrolase
MRGYLALLLLFAGFAPLAPRADVAYPPVLAGTALAFPRDHGAHPDFRIEWWYLTGWLDDDVPAAPGAKPQARGFQLTFFRLRPGAQEGNPSAFAPKQLVFAHAAVSDPAHGRLRHAERSARAGFGLALAATGDTNVAIDDWSLVREAKPPATDARGGTAASADGTERYLASARGEGFAYRLIATTSSPPLLQGADPRAAGFSQKGREPRHASHYYSRPQLAVEGTLTLDGQTRRVRGRAWLDHEWSSEAMPEGAVGWDWLGANLHDGGALMAFRLRDATDRTLWAGGTLALPGREPRRFGPQDVSFTPLRRWKSPRTGGDYAVEMGVQAAGKTWRLVPLLDDQELDSRGSVGAVYWEGAVRVFGGDGRPDAEVGRGYLEMTGIVARLRM